MSGTQAHLRTGLGEPVYERINAEIVDLPADKVAHAGLGHPEQ
jgi:hypothetical protein